MTVRKILPLRRLIPLIKNFRQKGKKIVFTNGTFDILHLGHVTYLEKARNLGDILIVGVNSDASVRSYKGPGRPLNPEKDRLRVLASLACVDFVVLFNEPTPLRLILQLKPDVLVKGSDWKKNQIVGAKEIKSWGGRVRRIQMVKGRSTTNSLKKLGLA